MMRTIRMALLLLLLQPSFAGETQGTRRVEWRATPVLCYEAGKEGIVAVLRSREEALRFAKEHGPKPAAPSRPGECGTREACFPLLHKIDFSKECLVVIRVVSSMHRPPLVESVEDAGTELRVHCLVSKDDGDADGSRFLGVVLASTELPIRGVLEAASKEGYEKRRAGGKK